MQEIATDEAPASIGPYSQAIRDGDTVYVSGQGPIDPETGEIADGDITTQAEQTFDNIGAILRAAGTSLDNVLKATVFVGDMSDYDAVNEVYAERMSDPFPARSAVEVGEFPVDIGIEIEVVATVE